MPRRARCDAPGVLQHVMFRGIEKRKIFHDDFDRRDLVERLARLVPEEGFVCFAWALMPNHVHLLLRTGPTPLSRLMARVGTGYAQAFNRRHGRVGHLFQNRFKSVLVEHDAHLRVLVPYVHLNPVRAGIVPGVVELASYPWTGHGALMGRGPRRFLGAREVLAWYGQEEAAARSSLVAGMEESLRLARESEPDGDDAGPAPGRRRYGGRRLPASGPPGPVDRLLDQVCGRVGADPDAVLAGRRHEKAVIARAVTAHLAVMRLGLPVVEVASALRLDASAASRSATRGARLLARLGPDGSAGTSPSWEKGAGTGG
ncbi:MAG: transposase [Myxococcota bacterium]|nr:transposase [Myxococcota bacterium]